MIDQKPPTMAELLAHREALERIAHAHGASNIRVVGSIARGDARPDSDIDLVVDMEDDRDVLDLSELVLDLQGELGRPVDVLRAPRAGGGYGPSPTQQIVANALPLPKSVPESQATGSGENRDVRLIGELRESIRLVQAYAVGGRAAFMGNDLVVDATRYRLGEIADACGRLSEGFKAHHPTVRWRALTGLAAVIKHGPHGAWEVLNEHMSALKQVIEPDMSNDEIQWST